jgi:hypothetical protein
VIAFGTAVTNDELYDRCAKPGIELASEPDSVVFAHQSAGSLYRNYNLMLDKAKKLDDLEALVLLHQDAEIVSEGFLGQIREALKDPEVAIIGVAGALGVRSIAWWEGAVTWASFTHRYTELGGGQFDSFTFIPGESPSYAETGEVDSIDGFVIVLSPWAVHNLRFDESLGRLHGYDFDICCQAREVGKKVVTVDTKVVHHHSLTLISNADAWVEAYIRLADKWNDRLIHREQDEGEVDWRQRALRSEAECAAAQGRAISAQMHFEALENLHLRAVNSTSWKLTAPLRAISSRFKRRSRRDGDS